MLTWDIVGQLAWTGVASSTYYCLFAVAFALTLKINRIWNFGQAAMMVVAYFAMFVSFRTLGLPPAIGILVGGTATIAVSVAIEWFGFRVLRARNSSVLTYFIFTIVLSQFAIYVAELIFGPDPKTLVPLDHVARIPCRPDRRQPLGPGGARCDRWCSCSRSPLSCATPRTGNSCSRSPTTRTSRRFTASAPRAPTASPW